MDSTLNLNTGPARAIISLQQWLADVGVTACTAWRWRKKGWLKTVNICGRQYLTQEAIDEFSRQRPPPQEMPQPRPTEKTAQKTHPEKTGF
jgi:hypothetical protein